MTASKNRPELRRWLFLASYCGLLYIAHTLPAEQLPEAVVHANDKLLHFFDFLLLALLTFRAFSVASIPLVYEAAGAKAAIFSLGYGAFLEVLQHFIPGRWMSFSDLVADALGAGAGYLTCYAERFLPPFVLFRRR